MRLQFRLSLVLATLLCAFHLSNSFKFANKPTEHQIHSHFEKEATAGGEQKQSEHRPAHKGHPEHPMHKVHDLSHEASPGDQSQVAEDSNNKETGEHKLEEIEHESDETEDGKDTGDSESLEDETHEDEEDNPDTSQTEDSKLKEEHHALNTEKTSNTWLGDRHEGSSHGSQGHSANNRPPEAEHKFPEHGRPNSDIKHPASDNVHHMAGHIHQEHDSESLPDDQDRPGSDNERPEPGNIRNGPPHDESHGSCTFDNLTQMFMERRKKGDNKNTDIDLLMDFVLLLARREVGRMRDDDVKHPDNWWNLDMKKDGRRPLPEPDETDTEIGHKPNHRYPDGFGLPLSDHAPDMSESRRPEHDNDQRHPDQERPQPDFERPEPDSVRVGPSHAESHGPCTFDMVKVFIERRKKCDKKKTNMDLLVDIALLIMEREAGRMGDGVMTDSDDMWHSEMKGDPSSKLDNLHDQKQSLDNKFPSLSDKEGATEDKKSLHGWFRDLHEDRLFDGRGSDMGQRDFFHKANEDQSRTATSGKDWFHGQVDTGDDHNGMHHIWNKHTQMDIDRMLEELHEKILSKREQEGYEGWPDLKGWAKSNIWPILKMQGKGKDNFEEKHDLDIDEKMDVMLDEFKKKCIIEKDQESQGQKGQKEWLELKRWMMFKIRSLIKLRWRGDDSTGEDWFGMGHGSEDDGNDRSGIWNKFRKDNNDNIQGKTADLKQEGNGSSKFGGSLGLLTTVAILVISKAFFL